MSNLLEIRVPAEQSEGTRSQILRWLKAVGEPVVENEPLIELETDKVTVEVASPGAGVLRQILKEESQEIEPGEILGLIEPNGTLETKDSPIPEAAARHQAERRPTPAASDNASVRTGSASAALSPAVKRLMAEHNLQAGAVRGTGTNGRISADDVLAHIKLKPSNPVIEEGIRRVPHTPVRKRVAEHMVRSLLHTAPHVTTIFEADMTAVLAHRARHRAEFEQAGAPLTLTVYFLAALVHAIRAVPEANSRWTDEALEISDTINIGVGTALGDQGLVVPVLQDVHKLSLREIAASLNLLVTRARDGKLSTSDVRGGTFTISNHGVSGSLIATPIVINQPQAAILGVGKLERRVVAVTEGAEERMAVRSQCYVTLTIDHRVMDGFQANRFLQVFTTHLQNWPD